MNMFSYFSAIIFSILIIIFGGIIIANQERHKDERISESSITTADGTLSVPSGERTA